MAKVRVYELAKEFGVESKAVMAKLQEMGEFVRSASSTIEAPVVRRLKDEFAQPGGQGRRRWRGSKAPSAARRSANGTAAEVQEAPARPAANGQVPAAAEPQAQQPAEQPTAQEPPAAGRSAVRSGCHRAVPGRPECRAAGTAGGDHAGQAGVRRSGHQVGTAACRGRTAAVGARVRPAAHAAARTAPWQQPVQLDCDRHGGHTAHPAGRRSGHAGHGHARCADRSRQPAPGRPARCR